MKPRWFDWIFITIVAGFALLLLVEVYKAIGGWGIFFLVGMVIAFAIAFSIDKEDSDYEQMKLEKRREQVAKWKAEKRKRGERV